MKNILFTQKQYYLASLTLLCVIVNFCRIQYFDTNRYFFLNWNLFLGIIPYGLSLLILHSKTVHKSIYLLGFTFFLWLIFIPNSPYIFTDVIHIITKKQSIVPVWFDISMIFLYAWTSLSFGFLSIRNIELFASKFLTKKHLNAAIIMLLFLISFGVFIGRVLRWNSWEIFSAPLLFVSDILRIILHPNQNIGFMAFTFLFGLFLNAIYFTKNIKD